MRAMIPELFDYYDKEVSELIAKKYGYTHMDALRLFLDSETRSMLEDPKLAMCEFSPLAIFDMWKAEKATGDPRNSVYLRGE